MLRLRAFLYSVIAIFITGKGRDLSEVSNILKFSFSDVTHLGSL